MRLLATFGYQKVLFAVTQHMPALIEALSTAQLVDEAGPWDARVYQPTSGGEMELKLLSEQDIRLPETARPESLDKLLEVAKERDELARKVRSLEQQIKKITDSLPKAEAA